MKCYFAWRHSGAVWCYRYLPWVLFGATVAGAAVWSAADVHFFSRDGRVGLLQMNSVFGAVLVWLLCGVLVGLMVYLAAKLFCLHVLLRRYSEEYEKDVCSGVKISTDRTKRRIDILEK